MYRIERITALVIDLIPMAVFTTILSIFIFPELSSLAFLLLAPTFPDVTSTVTSTVFSFPFYNSFWMYFVFTGIFFKGSIGKRVMHLRLVNSSGKLKFKDLLKRYSPLILSGLFFSLFTAIFIQNHESMNHQCVEAVLNSYFILVPVYLVASNIPNDQSFYDQLAGTKIIKIEQNKSAHTTSAIAPR